MLPGHVFFKYAQSLQLCSGNINTLAMSRNLECPGNAVALILFADLPYSVQLI